MSPERLRIRNHCRFGCKGRNHKRSGSGCAWATRVKPSSGLGQAVSARQLCTTAEHRRYCCACILCCRKCSCKFHLSDEHWTMISLGLNSWFKYRRLVPTVPRLGPSGLLLIANVSTGQAMWAPSSAQPLILSETSVAGMATATVHIVSKLPNSRLTVDIAVLETNGSSVLAATSVRVVRAPAPRLTVHASQQLLHGKGTRETLEYNDNSTISRLGKCPVCAESAGLGIGYQRSSAQFILLECSVAMMDCLRYLPTNRSRLSTPDYMPNELSFDSRGVAQMKSDDISTATRAARAHCFCEQCRGTCGS